MKSLFKLLIIGIILITNSTAYSISLLLKGSMSYYVDISHLTGEAGSNLKTRYTTDSNAVEIKVQSTKNDWMISVQLVTGYWHPDISVGIRRTSDGWGDINSWVYGGMEWLTLDQTSKTFFLGSQRRAGLYIQGEIDGMSLNVPPDSYSCAVVYTIVEI